MSVDDDADFSPASALPILRALRSANPDAPRAELRRFARKFAGKGLDYTVGVYADYKNWRSSLGSPPVLAQAHSTIKPPASLWISSSGSQGPATDGTPIIFLEVARIDLNLYSLDDYVRSLCHITDEVFSREEEGHLTVLVDLRRGDGWANMPPMSLFPFLKEAMKVLSKMYPDRTKRFVVYPVPWVATFMVSMVKKMMEPEQRRKLVLLAGDLGAMDCPPDALRDYVTIESVPVRSWPRHRSLDPHKVPAVVDTPMKKTPTHDDDGGESFYSCSDGENEDFDLESGLLEVNPTPLRRQRTDDNRFGLDEHRKVQQECSRLSLAFRWLFRCRVCNHRKRLEDPHSR